MEAPGLWPLAYTTVTATQDPSQVCNLHYSSQPCQIPNPLSKARRDQIRILMDTSRIPYRCATTGLHQGIFFFLENELTVYVCLFLVSAFCDLDLCLSLYKYHTVLNSGTIRLPRLLFFLKTVSVFLNPLHFHISFKITFSIDTKKHIKF